MRTNKDVISAIVVSLLMMSSLIAAQQKIPLWEGSVPGNIPTEVKEECKVSDWGSKILTGVSVPELTFFKSDSSGVLPAVVICPGGGYEVEAYEHEGELVAKWLNALGMHVFVLKYRLPDERITFNCEWVPLLDAQQAISLVRRNSEEWNVNSDEIGIMGFSAGGHLAATASNIFYNPIGDRNNNSVVRPDFSILMYPVISMDTTITHIGSRNALIGKNPTVDLVKQFSMEKQVSVQTPPTFILHAIDDGAVPVDNTNRYADALKKAGIPCQKILLQEGGHGFGYRPESPAFIWTEYLADWLNANVIKK